MEFKLPPFLVSSSTTTTPAAVVANENKTIRNKEHVHGNWPTIIFLPIEGSSVIEEFLASDTFRESNFEMISPLLVSNSNLKSLPYHISLTRTLYLKEHQRDLFHKKIAEALRSLPRLPQVLKCRQNLAIYLNDEATRTFLAVDVERDEVILKYIEAIDRVLEGFGLPIYYKNPQLHFSVASFTGGHPTTSYKLSDEFEVKLDNGIILKCGNKCFSM